MPHDPSAEAHASNIPLTLRFHSSCFFACCTCLLVKGFPAAAPTTAAALQMTQSLICTPQRPQHIDAETDTVQQSVKKDMLTPFNVFRSLDAQAMPNTQRAFVQLSRHIATAACSDWLTGKNVDQTTKISTLKTSALAA